MSLVLTLPDPNVGNANSFPFSRMVGAVICSRRKCIARVCLLAATRSPDTFSPAVFLPENVKTGIFPSPCDLDACSSDPFHRTSAFHWRCLSLQSRLVWLPGCGHD